MVYTPPINNRLGPTNMAPMGCKTIVVGSSIQSFFEIGGSGLWTKTLGGKKNGRLHFLLTSCVGLLRQ